MTYQEVQEHFHGRVPKGLREMSSDIILSIAKGKKFSRVANKLSKMWLFTKN